MGLWRSRKEPDRRQTRHVVDRIWGRAYSSGTQGGDNSLTPSSPPFQAFIPLVPPRPAAIPALAYEPQSRGQFRGPTPVVILDSSLCTGSFRARRSRKRRYPSGPSLSVGVSQPVLQVPVPVSQVSSVVFTLHRAG